MEKSQQIAAQIQSMPPSQARSQMMQLKQQDPVLHGVVRDQLDTMKNQAQTAGGAQILAQAAQNGQKQAAWKQMSTASLLAMLQRKAG
jgi:hypothetical protein